MEKNCENCIENDNGLCDRKGILVHEDDDFCQNWNGNADPEWKERVLNTFLAGH